MTIDKKSIIPKIARYLALAKDLQLKSSPEMYVEANALGWELAMVLPSASYKEIVRAICQPTQTHNPFSIILEVRKTIGTDGELTMNDIAIHAPGIGLKK